MKIEKKIKQKLLETKEIKDRSIIQETLVKNRLLAVVESADNVRNYKKLTVKQHIDYSIDLLEEIANLDEEGLINEGLGDMLSTLFGSSWSGFWQMITEPLVKSILSKLGMEDGYFMNFLVSIFTKNPLRLAKALRGDCNELTKLVVESIVEAIETKILADRGMTGAGWSFVKNAINDAIHGTEFSASLEKAMSSTICELFNKLTGKASEVISNLKGGNSTQPVPAS